MRKTKARWAAQISAAWQKSVAAIFQCGDLLTAAKRKMPHGEFQKMVDADLPFGPQTASRLMAVAADKRLRKASHGTLLPTSWRTLWEMTRLPADKLASLLKKKDVSNLTRFDIELLMSPQLRQVRVESTEKVERAIVPYYVKTGESGPVIKGEWPSKVVSLSVPLLPHRSAFLLHAHEAVRLAIHPGGTIDDQYIGAARAVVEAWTDLLHRFEEEAAA